MTAPPLVLLVEDNELVTQALRVLLEATGHRVATAESLADARARVADERPAVILLDLTLPDGDGLALLAEPAAEAPTVTYAMTGHDDAGTAARCRAAGCRDVLVKPVPVKVLVEKVREGVTAGSAAPRA